MRQIIKNLVVLMGIVCPLSIFSAQPSSDPGVAGVKQAYSRLNPEIKRSGKMQLGKGDAATILVNRLADAIPPQTVKLIGDLTLENVKLVPAGGMTIPGSSKQTPGKPAVGGMPMVGGGALGFGITGTALLKGRRVQITIYVMKPPMYDPDAAAGAMQGKGPKAKGRLLTGTLKSRGPAGGLTRTPIEPPVGVALVIGFPPEMKAGDAFPELAIFDRLGLSNEAIIFSNCSFYEGQTYAFVQPGINFVANIDLKGPFAGFEKLAKTMSPSYFAEGGEAFFNATIHPTILGGMQAYIVLPTGFGVDFTKLKVPQWWPFNFLKTSDMIVMTDFSALATGKLPTFMVSAGIMAGLKRQKQPLEFRAGVNFTPPSVWTIYGSMEYMLERAFGISWLSIGNLGLEVSKDILIPNPPSIITGIGLRGDVILGEGEDAVTASVAGKTEMRATTIPEFVLDGSITKIPMSAIFQTVNKAIGKNIAPEKVPYMEFRNVRLTVVPAQTAIAGKFYTQGIQAGGELYIGDWYGFVDFAISNQTKDLRLDGYLMPIDYKWLRFTGTYLDKASGQKFEGAAVHMLMSMVTQEAYISGVLEIPPLGMKQNIQFSLDFEKGIYAKQRNTSIFGFLDTTILIRVPFTFAKGKRDFSFNNILIYAIVQRKALEDLVKDELKKLSDAAAQRSGVLGKTISLASSVLQKVAQVAEVIHIAGAVVKITGDDIRNLRTAKMSVYIKIAGSKHILRDIQIDYKNPVDTAKNIAKSIFNFVKGD